MNDARDDHVDKLIDASAAALGIPVEPDWKGGIKANLQVTLRATRHSTPSRRSRASVLPPKRAPSTRRMHPA